MQALLSTSKICQLILYPGLITHGNSTFSLNEIFVLQAVEALRRMNGVTHQWTFKFVHYSQSNACDHVNSSSVSYAAGVLFSKP